VNPRNAQILALLLLLGLGASLRDFSLSPEQVILTFVAGLLAQKFYLKIFNIPLSGRGAYLSAVITCFGISLLLRSDSYWVHPLAASIAISAKFLIRFRGKHLFNPANFGVLVPVLLLPGTWVSAGQWGSDVALAFLLFALGSYVISRAGVVQSSWMFLFSYLGIWAGYRVLYLGYEWNVWLHQLNSGALLLFAFFMISDPKTSPDNKVARMVHVASVAVLVHLFSYYFYFTNGLLLALLVASPLVPILDAICLGEKFRWDEEVTFTDKEEKQREQEDWKKELGKAALNPGAGAQPLAHIR
jgi:Na+-transporting NADH:ubiquinone oxidoreductase subunit NqrB